MEPPPANDDEKRGPTNLIVLVIAVLLVVGSIWLLLAFRQSSARLDCYAAHHSNCDPIPLNQ